MAKWYPGKFIKKLKTKRAKKKADKSWTKAVARNKELDVNATGETLNDLISKRKELKKGTPEYARVQNKINAAYGVKKRH